MTDKPNLVYVRYYDHVEFKYCDPSRLGPCIREAVGWVDRENEQFLCLLYNRNLEPFPFEKRECGFIILKSDIFERKVIA